MERELGQLVSVSESPTSQAQGHLIDRMQGIGFLSVIDFARGKPKVSTSRALMVDLAYSASQAQARFGDILRFSLNKEAPLRAWCEETRTYEAVVQRKLATNLPSLLSLSCCCAGRAADGLECWQQEESRNWLPEFIEIQIETDRSITVRELAMNDEGEEEWITFEQKLPLPASFFESLDEKLPQNLPIKKAYRLDAVVSFIRSNSDIEDSRSEGHHVVHVRAPVDVQIKALSNQLRQIQKCLAEKEQGPSSDNEVDSPITLVSGVSLEERKQSVEVQLKKLQEEGSGSQWLLLNGFVVSRSDPDDVRSFNAKCKEP